MKIRLIIVIIIICVDNWFSFVAGIGLTRNIQQRHEHAKATQKGLTGHLSREHILQCINLCILKQTDYK